jgi:hypothetical protein
MPQDDEKHENVVSLADARRRQRTVQKPTAANGRAAPKGGRAGASSKAERPPRKFWAYVQFVLFLAVVAYMMQLCKSGA